MEFFHSQEALTNMQWILRALVAFIFLMVIARALGQRTMSQLRLIDFVIALVIGNIISHPLSDEGLGLTGSMITTLVLVVLHFLSVLGVLNSPFLRKILNPKPVTVVKNGEILYDGLKKARISIDILLEELREAKAHDIKKVALAIWEADGKLSVFLDPKYEPITPSFYNMKAKAFDYPRTIIKDGRIISKELEQINKDEAWLTSSLKSLYGAEVKEVLLGTVDGEGNINVFLYNKYKK